jgi:uncharacterized membrane protein
MRRTMWGAAATGLAALAVALPASPVSAGGAGTEDGMTARPFHPVAHGYRVNRLPVLPDTVRSEATAMDRGGHWIGGEVDTADGVSHPVLWHDGVLTELTDIPLAFVRIRAVGDGGFVAGYGSGEDGNQRAFMISGGGYFELPLPDGAVGASADGLAANGDIAGTVTAADFSRRPVVWPGDRFGTVRELPLPAGLRGSVVGMAADGTVAVQSDSNDLTAVRSFVYAASGARTELRPATRGSRAFVQSVADGFAIGFEFDPVTFVNHTVRWNLRTRTARVVPPVSFTTAITDKGAYGGQSAEGTAVVVSPAGRLIDLPGLSTGAAEVEGIADNGNAAGFARDAAGTVSAVRWNR